jgi:signal transduction histidine kinase
VTNSFRFRLTLWWVGALAVLLVLFSLGVYSMLAGSAREQFDATLRAAGEVTALSVNHEIEEHHGRTEGEASIGLVLQTMHRVSFPRQSIVVFEGLRQVAAKPGIEGRETVAPGLAAGFHSDGAYRIAVFETAVPALRSKYTIVVSQSVRTLEEELAGFRRVLYWCVPMGILFASIGGYFLARRNLAPIVAMTDEVNRITSQSMHQRLAVGNSKDELGRLAGTFNELLERLNASFDDQRRFMADASHELRTPLSVALTAAQVNLDGGPRTTAEYQEALRIVTEQMRRLKRIVQEMFLLAQGDAGAFAPTVSSFYLDELIQEAVRAARIIGDPLGVRVLVEGLEEAPISGDEGLIRQMLLGLLDNAIRHTPAGGRVTLSAEVAGGMLRLGVADTGPGVDPALRATLFEPFVTGRADGTGLGLAIARELAEAMGGTLRLEDGPGAVFVLEVAWHAC